MRLPTSRRKTVVAALIEIQSPFWGNCRAVLLGNLSVITFLISSGNPFGCLVDIVPIKNEKGEVVLFLLSFKDISEFHGKKHHYIQGDGEAWTHTHTRTHTF